MGMNVGGSKGGPKSDINVTPLVDIVLVLLIVFLMITPIKMRYMSIEVPRKLDQEREIVTSSQIVVTIRANNSIKLTGSGDPLELANVFELGQPLRTMIEKQRTEKVVFLDIEDPVLYGDAVTVMDAIKAAGAEKVALKTKEEE